MNRGVRPRCFSWGSDPGALAMQSMAAAVRVDQRANGHFGRHVHGRQELGGALQADGGNRGDRLVDDVTGTKIGARVLDVVPVELCARVGHDRFSWSFQ